MSKSAPAYNPFDFEARSRSKTPQVHMFQRMETFAPNKPGKQASGMWQNRLSQPPPPSLKNPHCTSQFSFSAALLAEAAARCTSPATRGSAS